MKKTRIFMAALMVVAVIGMFYQSAAAASDSCMSPDGYYCTYSLSLVSGDAFANMTASKSSGVLANPLTAEIIGTVVSDDNPGGTGFCNTVTQFGNGSYISCEASYEEYDYVRSAVAVFKLNSYPIDDLYAF